MTTSVQPVYITPEEYVEREAASPVKHEYFDGRIFAMAGATPTHCLVNSNISGALFSRLRGRSCRGTGSDQRVKVEATDFMAYPDTLIVCAPERYDEKDPNSLLNPRVIIEVLSPSTELYDRTGKFDQYEQPAWFCCRTKERSGPDSSAQSHRSSGKTSVCTPGE